MLPQKKWGHIQMLQKSGGQIRCPPSGIGRPYYGTALKELVILAIPLVSALPIPVEVLVPNAASTAAMTQTATITYSNDTTPSLSARRRFNASVVLT